MIKIVNLLNNILVMESERIAMCEWFSVNGQLGFKQILFFEAIEANFGNVNKMLLEVFQIDNDAKKAINRVITKIRRTISYLNTFAYGLDFSK